MSRGPTWSTCLSPGQPRVHRETLCQKAKLKQTKIAIKKKPKTEALHDRGMELILKMKQDQCCDFICLFI